jgi:hypothetical protein
MLTDLSHDIIDIFIKEVLVNELQVKDVQQENYNDSYRIVKKLTFEDFTLMFSTFYIMPHHTCMSRYIDIEVPLEFNINGTVFSLVEINPILKLLSIYVIEQKEETLLLRIEVGYELSTVILSSSIIGELLSQLNKIETDVKNLIRDNIEYAESIPADELL